MVVSQRGIRFDEQAAWAKSIDLQERLRLKWFRRNKERLDEIANTKSTRTVSEETKNQMKTELIKSYQDVEKFPMIKTRDLEPIEPRAYQHIMKPVNPETHQLIYSGNNKDGRTNYLKKRILLLPDQRYYFPEVSSFIYGWQICETSKGIKRSNFGRQQIIKQTFYRRRGVNRDPDWYTEPATYSPTTCTSK